MNKKVAVVTGSSSGIGFATSLVLARNGFYTYATMRNLAKSQGIMDASKKDSLPIQVIQLDVNDEQSVKTAIDKIIKEKGRIDILVNNAGYGLAGAFEDVSMEEVKSQFETNLFGIIRVTQAVIPYMRKQKQGIIINVSSVGGRIALPMVSAYTSTKFALEGLSESMRFELEPFGIKVVIIEPGVIGTNFTKAMVMAKKAQDPNSPYAQLAQKVNTTFSYMFENNASPPHKVAEVILKAVTAQNPEPRYLAGDDAVMWMEKRKNMSDVEFEQFWKKTLLEPTV